MHSNDWAIHGKHTENGMPLLSADPHLNNVIPTTWQLQELIFDDKNIIGSSFPGGPGIAIGRSNSLAWGITVSLTDSADLWQEVTNDDFTQYKVDGEWRNFEKVVERIQIKGKEPFDFEINYTHRGPVMDFKLITSSVSALFSGKIPKMSNNAMYSLGWANRNIVEDHSIKMFHKLNTAQSVKEVMNYFDEIGTNGWNAA